MSERIVAVVYVTKWAGPIRVWKDAHLNEEGEQCYHPDYGRHGNFMVAASGEWTEDRDLAEDRWRIKQNANIKAAQRKIAAAEKALRDGPAWEEK